MSKKRHKGSAKKPQKRTHHNKYAHEDGQTTHSRRAQPPVSHRQQIQSHKPFKYSKVTFEQISEVAVEIFGGTTYFCYYSSDATNETSD